MTAYIIDLKQRAPDGFLQVPIEQIAPLVISGDKDALFEKFALLNQYPGVHDKFWLKMIVDWMPEGGLPLTETAKWIKLARRVGELDDSREGPFTLSDFQADLIWNRINSPEFKIRRMDAAFLEFLSEFQEKTGRHFISEDPTPE